MGKNTFPMPNMRPFEKIENLLNNFRKKNFQTFSDGSEFFFALQYIKN